MSVIITGGGITGATLALAISYLTKGKMPVTVVEAISPENNAHPSYNGRAIALSAGTCQQLTNINLWSALADYATPITNVQISDRGHIGVLTINATDYGITALGNVVELPKIGSRLYQMLRKAKGVTLFCPETVTQVEYRQDEVSVTMSNGVKLDSQLLVAADGSHSNIATASGIQWYNEDYQQIAVIANVTTQIIHEGRAYERFTQHGPLALLPISNGKSSLIWCHPLKTKTHIEKWTDSVFLMELQQAFGWRLGRFTHVEQRYYYPLILHKAKQTVSHRLALVGNAAQTLHPIAGQGLNLGMRDVMSLATVLSVAHHERKDIGNITILQRYSQQREIDRNTIIWITDGLIRLFTNHYLPLIIGRNFGLIMIDNLSWLRNRLVRRMLD